MGCEAFYDHKYNDPDDDFSLFLLYAVIEEDGLLVYQYEMQWKRHSGITGFIFIKGTD